MNCEDDLRFVDYDFSKQNLKALINAVNIQYESSDVGVGCFLSGGIDSSLITSLLQSNKRSKNSLKTFSIGFNDSTYDEAKYAKEIASFLKTDHHELYLDKNDLIDIIPKLSHVYDEPFSDSSQIPTMLVSKFAREYVPVVLSGDAGDELFGGYTRYLYTKKYWNFLKKIPLNFRKIIKNLVRFPSLKVYDFLFEQFNVKKSGNRILKGINFIDAQNEFIFYENMISHWINDDIMMNSEVNTSRVVFDENLSLLDNMMNHDFNNYLSGDILTKVDRASMAYSLETRVPFLDKDVISLSLKIPLEHKIKGNVSKYILKDILKDYLPENLYERPKMGFGIPLGSIISNEMLDWVNSLLNHSELSKHNFLKNDVILKMWDDHLKQKKDWSYLLWDVIIFQQWYNNNFQN